NGAEARLEQLPDGYSSLLRIWAELELRAEAVRRLNPEVTHCQGIAIIDELEAHLHLELQAQVLPTLVELFPNYQFVIATHSPAVIASIPNSVVHDLSSGARTTGAELQGIPYGCIMTGHFGIEHDRDRDTTALRAEWLRLLHRSSRTAEEQQNLEKLAAELSRRSATLSLEVWDAMERPRLEQLIREQERDQSQARPRATFAA
ncbi:MAG: hypothetical protein FJX77_03850, partial [Armatimonadetes bacterium]|nr:hypothetical protein [Armatimonadota bacterium]